MLTNFYSRVKHKSAMRSCGLLLSFITIIMFLLLLTNNEITMFTDACIFLPLVLIPSLYYHYYYHKYCRNYSRCFFSVSYQSKEEFSWLLCDMTRTKTKPKNQTKESTRNSSLKAGFLKIFLSAKNIVANLFILQKRILWDTFELILCNVLLWHLLLNIKSHQYVNSGWIQNVNKKEIKF